MTYLDLLPNPFLPHLNPAAGSAAPVVTIAPSPAAGAAAYSAEDMAWAEQAIDKFYENAAPGLSASQHAERLPSSDAAGLGAAAFQLDERAFMQEIEPGPAFLTRDECQNTLSGQVISDPRADQIEELLKIALADEWPAPPRRMVG